LIKKLAFLLLFLPASAHALTVKHYLTAIIGPFNASKTEFEYTLQPDSYAVISTVKTSGLFNTLYPFEAKYETSGRIRNNKIETISYKHSSKSRFTKRSKELVYNDKGKPIYSLSVKNKEEKKRIIDTPPDAVDSNDLQTVIALFAKQYNTKRSCDGIMRVFDGKRRFNVIFKNEGAELIKANDHSPFSGTAIKCSMYIDKLASTGNDLLWKMTSERPIYFWILEDSTTQAPFIAHVHIGDTPLGEMNVYASKIRVKK